MAEYGRLENEAQVRWNALVRSNDRRMTLTDRALASGKNTALGTLQQQTRAITPTHQTLKANKISYQAFDSLQTLMLAALAQNIEVIDTALVSQIRAADDSVLVYRVLYDQAAEKYNAYLEQHKKGLARQTGKTYEELVKPTFTLGS